MGLDSVRMDLQDLRNELTDKLDQTHELLAITHMKINQMFLLNTLTFTATGSIMPLSEDAAEHTREKAKNVMMNCESVKVGNFKFYFI